MLENLSVVIDRSEEKIVTYHLSCEGQKYTLEEHYQNDMLLGRIARNKDRLIVSQAKLEKLIKIVKQYTQK